jgi:subtilisin family serine protease
MAEAITRLAIEHGIGGQVVLNVDEAGALATLIDEPSPFKEMGGASLEELMLWLKRVLAKQPDIVLLDYGAPVPVELIEQPQGSDPQRVLLRSIHYLSLLIAAGGNRPEQDPALVTVPSAYPEVLSIGPLDDEGGLRPYAEWHPPLVKPDLFMADDLSQTALATALKPDVLEFQHWGSSFSALHAVATAALVWSILPDLSPRAVRAMLVEASKPIAGMEPARSLTIEDAVALARRRVVNRTLKAGAASFQTLGATTGLEARVLRATLDSLIEDEQVVRLTSGRLERFQLA